MRVNRFVAGLRVFCAILFIVILEHTLCLCFKRVYSEAVHRLCEQQPRVAHTHTALLYGIIFSRGWFSLLPPCSSCTVNIRNTLPLLPVGDHITWPGNERSNYRLHRWKISESHCLFVACSILLQLWSWWTRVTRQKLWKQWNERRFQKGLSHIYFPLSTIGS